MWSTTLTAPAVIDVPTISGLISNKAAAGYPVSLADAVGLEINSRQLGLPNYGVATLFSGVASYTSMSQYLAPLPIITVIGVDPTTSCAGLAGTTQYEVSPYEFGSWDKGVAAFTPTKYLGTSLVGGLPLNQTACTTGFDEQTCKLQSHYLPFGVQSRIVVS